MSVSTIVISQNPVVARPKPASFSLTLFGDGGIRFVPASETHSLVDQGWFLTAGFDIEGSEDQLNEIFSNGLARAITIYDELGILAWEGIATTYTIKTRTTERLVSLENIANRIIIRVNVDGNKHAKTKRFNDTDSQNQYGILTKVLHITKNTDGLGNADNIKQVAQDNMSDPYKMVEINNIINTTIPRGHAILSVTCKGYMFYMTKRRFNKLTKNTAANISTVIAEIITDKGDFVASTKIVTNTQQVNQHFRGDKMAFTHISSLSKESDSSNNKYIFGMSEGRVFFYRKRATEALNNLRLTRDRDGIVRDTREGFISPIRIVPDQYMRDTSIMNEPGTIYKKMRLDPQVSYIERVVYRNANDEAQIVSVRKTHRNRRLRKAIRKAIAEA